MITLELEYHMVVNIKEDKYSKGLIDCSVSSLGINHPMHQASMTDEKHQLVFKTALND